jgi:hypothetical protein
MLNQEQIGDLVDRKKYLEGVLNITKTSPNVDVSLHYELKSIKKKLAADKAKATRNALTKAHKLCPACGKEKPLTAFYKDDKTYTGYSSKCKVCLKEEG